MSSDSQTWWSFPVVAPLADGGVGYAEVFGHLIEGEKSVGESHGQIVSGDPHRWTNRPSNQAELRAAVSPGQALISDFSDFVWPIAGCGRVGELVR